jgi:hypothetical protein
MTDADHPVSGQQGDAQAAFDVLSKHMLLGRLDVLLESAGEVAYSAVSEHYGGVPSVGSQMESDIADVSVDAVGNVQRICGVWNLVAAENLEAVASAHADGRILFAPGPLLRTTIEHAARIGWVLDGASARERAARSWLAQVVANAEDAHTHRNAGRPTPTLAGAPERLEELCEQTLPQIFEGARPDRTRGRPADWRFVGQAWGTNTGTVRDFFENHVHERWGPQTDGRVQYRIASMFAHPSTTAIFVQADQSEPGSGVFTWDWPLTRSRTVVALIAFQASCASLYDYLGWDPPRFNAWTGHLSRFVTETASPAEDAQRDS